MRAEATAALARVGRISPVVVGVILALSALAAARSPDPSIVLLGALSLLATIWLLWCDGRLLLFVPVGYQWSEVAVQPILSAIRGQPLNNFAQYGADLSRGATLGFLSVAALAAGLALGCSWRVGAKPAVIEVRLRTEAAKWGRPAILKFTLGCMALGYVLRGAAFVAGGARETLLQFAQVEYVGLFALFYWCLVRRRDYLLLAGFLGFEIVTGMTGFFADFRVTFVVLASALIAAGVRLRLRDLLISGAVGLVLVSVAVVWTAVKVDYRAFVNHGSGEQVVLEPMGRRLQFLGRSIADLDGRNLSKGFNDLLARHSYIEFLSLTMQNTPGGVTDQYGAQTAAALRHITTPRLLFPDKAALPSDTSVTSRLTGLQATESTSTSISVGYLGELFADFGGVGATVAVFIFGVIFGMGFAFLRDGAWPSALVVGGVLATFAISVSWFETSLAKTLGDSVFAFVSGLVIIKLAGPNLLRLLHARPAFAPVR